MYRNNKNNKKIKTLTTGREKMPGKNGTFAESTYPSSKPTTLTHKKDELKSMDKDKHGYRYDSVALTNGLIENGIYAVRVDYKPREHDAFASYVKEEKFDAILVRINPGQIKPYRNQERFDDLMEQLENKTDILIFGNKASLRNMGSKIALVKIRKLACGLRDTRAYYTKKEMERGLKKGLKTWPRVLKQNRGSTGCGIWLVWLKGKHDRIMNMTSEERSSNGSSNSYKEDKKQNKNKNKKTKNGAKMRMINS